MATTGRQIAVRVTGIFRRSPRAGAFWTLDPAGSALPRTVGVLDRAGRLQIPRDFVETLDMRDRVLLALESDHVGVWPDAAGRDGAAGPVVRRRVHGRHERDGGRPAPDDEQREA